MQWTTTGGTDSIVLQTQHYYPSTSYTPRPSHHYGGEPASKTSEISTHTTCVTLDYKYQLSFYPGKHHKHLTLIQCTVIQYKHKTVTCQIKGNNKVGTLSMWVCGMRNDINTFFCKRYMIEKIENRGDTGPGTTLTGGGTDLVNDDLPGTGIWGGL